MCKVFQMIENKGKYTAYEIGSVSNDKELDKLIKVLGLDEEFENGEIFVSQKDE